MTNIVCAREPDLPVEDFSRLLVESGLGVTRPVDDLPRMRQMLAQADLVLAARGEDGELVGVARCLTDFAWIAYLSELAVSQRAQGLGIGRQLLETVSKELGPNVTLVLASMPDAVGFYEAVGMPRMNDAFCFRRER
jgi:ribosomal protein S18 acetylase RimI-like enzyme